MNLEINLFKKLFLRQQSFLFSYFIKLLIYYLYHKTLHFIQYQQTYLFIRCIQIALTFPEEKSLTITHTLLKILAFKERSWPIMFLTSSIITIAMMRPYWKSSENRLRNTKEIYFEESIKNLIPNLNIPETQFSSTQDLQ